MPHILIVEDENIIRNALCRLLERHQYQVSEAESVQQAKERFDFSRFHLIISDLRLPGAPGTELIPLANGTPVLIMTSHASLRSAVDSMKLGAVDYIPKPFDHDEMLKAVAQSLDKRTGIVLRAPAGNSATFVPSNQAASAPTQATEGELGIIGSSPAMQALYRTIRKVAPANATVLIQGESGTGKELVARALHNFSSRAKAPLISVNCAAIPESLIESELFGHEKGAFTGAANARTGLVEAAHGGTLFLDEIGELPLEAQARLLRVLQEGEIRRIGSVHSQKVDVRLIAATHRKLKRLAHSGQFREDLFYRLNVISLELPPLRERGADVLEIARSFLQKQSIQLGSTLYFSPAAEQLICRYDWPGNVRELENAIERAAILCEQAQIEADLLGIEAAPPEEPEATSPNLSAEGNHEPDENLSLEDYFQHFVLEHQEHMTETELARKLGISRKCLWERRQRLGIPRHKGTVE